MSVTCQQHNQCLESALTQAQLICQESDVRLTHIRKQVLELIWSGHKPVKAYDLLTELQKSDIKAKPPTIYRALDFLMEQGLIHKLHRLNAYIGCVHPTDKRPCFFLICTHCQTVTESHDDAYKKFIDKISRSNHFKPQAMTFEVEGLCGQCA